MTISRLQIVNAARRWIGTPFHHQASRLQAGCDCLGLVRGVWRDLIGSEPEEAPPYGLDWAAVTGVDYLNEALERHFTQIDIWRYRAGDVLVFRFRPHGPATHLGIATSPEQMIHAHSGGSVTETTFGLHWRRRLVGAFIFPGVND